MKEQQQKATRFLSDAHRQRGNELMSLTATEASGLPSPATPHLDAVTAAIAAHRSGLPNRSAAKTGHTSAGNTCANPLMADLERRIAAQKKESN